MDDDNERWVIDDLVGNINVPATNQLGARLSDLGFGVCQLHSPSPTLRLHIDF